MAGRGRCGAGPSGGLGGALATPGSSPPAAVPRGPVRWSAAMACPPTRVPSSHGRGGPLLGPHAHAMPRLPAPTCRGGLCGRGPGAAGPGRLPGVIRRSRWPGPRRGDLLRGAACEALGPGRDPVLLVCVVHGEARATVPHVQRRLASCLRAPASQ
ncbi:hypothetical protein H696_05868 [Fonticula alba]|uniref:Uncharacterized protein n=1 Tax=Fonticula alba TaxID=691883 RepID=A0A058Z0E8_FONAL|nr:hypothetical protein H696_05868 [Fonticula alba]KCV67601.1 hypothetical protein H696_05868 [Fonticula alba]|eukprot:XP_009497939.1 hypothetical protein H696_05868 [Fonticula alba]